MSTLKDYYIAAGTGTAYVSGTQWRAQTFIASSNYTICSVKLKVQRSGYGGGNVIAAIRNTTAGIPSGSDLCSIVVNRDLLEASPGGWYEFIFSSQISLVSGTMYAIVFKGSIPDSGNMVYFTGSGDEYPAGNHFYTNDSGGSWTQYYTGTSDIAFETYAAGAAYSEGTLITSGSGSALLLSEEYVPNPNAEGTKGVWVWGFSSLASEVFVRNNWIPPKPVDPGLTWDEATSSWIADDGRAGGRWRNTLVVIARNESGTSNLLYSH